VEHIRRISVKKPVLLLAITLVLAAGCHTGIQKNDNEAYCQDVETFQQTVANTEFQTGMVRGEVNDDVNELGADGHCPGYNVSDSDA
jgi:hypothetical protein